MPSVRKVFLLEPFTNGGSKEDNSDSVMVDREKYPESLGHCALPWDLGLGPFLGEVAGIFVYMRVMMETTYIMVE